jgi:hypothetical protein
MNIFTKLKLFLILTVAALSVQAQSFNVTFRVDMSQYANLNDTVYVNGTWNSWCGRCNPMVKQGTTNIWEAVISIPSGNHEYKFTVGGWNAQESLNSSLPCTITTGGFTNRAVNVTAVAVLPTVCWNSCSACSSLQPVSLPVYFDSLNVDYGLTDFGGNASEIVVDPTNSSNKVAKVTKSNTAELWAGTTIGGTVGFSSAIPFASNANKMSVRVYSPDSGIAVRLKVEDPADAGKSVETEARTTTSNAWETLEFNFASQASGTAAINYTYTYKKASIFFNFGTTGATAGTKVYYFDDMMFLAPTAPSLSQIALPINFDSTNVNYTMTDFGGNTSSVVADPMNSSNKVAKVIKSNTAELWAGTTMSTSSGLAMAIPFAVGSTKISMRVYSPDSGIAVRLKAEDPNDNTKSVETETRTTTSNAWEVLEFNFANQASGTAAINFTYTYRMLSVFFNFGTTGATAGEKTYYFDDVMFLGTTPPVMAQIKLPINFDSTNVNYTMTDFGGNASSVVADPMNSSNKVAKVIKSNTAELWAGTTMSTPSGLAMAIPFAPGSTKISMRVYSPDSGIAVRLKAEDPNDNTKSVETETRTTTKNTWEVMEFNFANQASGTAAINFTYTYRMLSVFFNFGTTGATAGEKTYYFDDVMFLGTTPPVMAQIKLPINFDSTNVNYTMTDFGGNASSVVADPMNSSNKVAKVIKSNTAELWAGTTMSTPSGLAMAIPFAPGSTKISMRVYSPDSGIAVRLKAEDPNDNTKSVETETRTTTSNAWEVLEFNFANQASGTAAINFTYTYRMLSVFFNFGTTGATAGEKTYYFDDVVFGGGSTPPPPTKVNVTFNVDTKNLPLQASDVVTLNGTFNGWCGECTKMTKVTGTDTWTATVELDPKTEYEFKYSIGNWVSQETLNPSLSCTKTTSGFTNRVITTDTVNTNLPLTCWEHCTPCEAGGTTKTYATFRVDMQKQGLAATDTVTLNGSFNNWCGACTPMTKVAGTDVWMATVLLDKDSSYDYKYVIGNWVSQETLKEGMTCTTTKSGFTNRTLVVTKTNDTLPVVCWESCVDCQNTAPKAKVTFKVNMKNYVGDLTAGVTLNGSFNGWCGNCTPMTLIGSNIYAVTLNLDTGAYEFKYTVGNWDDQEQFSPSDLCTKTTGTFTNRYMEVKDETDLTVGAYCWNTCTICDAVGLTEQMLNAVKLYPNPASDNLFIDFGQMPTYESTIGVYSILGERIITKNSSRNYSGNGLNLDISGLKPGVYIVKIEMNQSVKTLKLQVQ